MPPTSAVPPARSFDGKPYAWALLSLRLPAACPRDALPELFGPVEDDLDLRRTLVVQGLDHQKSLAVRADVVILPERGCAFVVLLEDLARLSRRQRGRRGDGHGD